jgi:hypothetical protein
VTHIGLHHTYIKNSTRTKMSRFFVCQTFLLKCRCLVLDLPVLFVCELKKLQPEAVILLGCEQIHKYAKETFGTIYLRWRLSCFLVYLSGSQVFLSPFRAQMPRCADSHSSCPCLRLLISAAPRRVSKPSSKISMLFVEPCTTPQPVSPPHEDSG